MKVAVFSVLLLPLPLLLLLPPVVLVLNVPYLYRRLKHGYALLASANPPTNCKLNCVLLLCPLLQNRAGTNV